MRMSPFALIYSHKPQGLLQGVREAWEKVGCQEVGVHHYQQEMLEWLIKAGQLAQEHLAKAKQKQQWRYDKGARARECHIRDKVLVLLPTTVDELLTWWQGLFEIVQQAGSVDYEVHCPGHRKERQIYHVNLLRAWQELEGWLLSPEDPREDLGPEVEELPDEPEPGGSPMYGAELNAHQRDQLGMVVVKFREIFDERPGHA